MATLEWPFRISLEDDGTYRVFPVGFPNCEGIGADIEAAKKAGSTALSFVLDSGIASVPKLPPPFPAGAKELRNGSVARIRVELRNRSLEQHSSGRSRAIRPSPAAEATDSLFAP